MNDLAKLKDIKSVEFIAVDFTTYYIAFGLFVLFILFSYLIYFYIKNSNKKPTKKQIAKEYLKKMDFQNDSKTIAYDFTLNAKICLNEKFEDEYNGIVSKLEAYKYKKEVQNIPNELKDDMKEYIKVRL
jgi:hypothetical protein